MKKSKFACEKCKKKCGNAGGLARHKVIKHPAPPPPPPPKVTIENGPHDLEESLTLVGAGNKQLEVGDTFYHVRKFVVRQTKRTEGKDETVVQALCVRRHWQKNQPL